MAVSLKTKHETTIQSSNCIPGYLSQGKWRFMFTLKNQSMNVYSSFIHHSPRLETTQMSFNGWRVKQAVVHLYHGILFSNKKKSRTIDTLIHLNESLENCAEWKKGNLKSLHTVIFLILPKLFNFLKKKKRQLMLCT